MDNKQLLPIAQVVYSDAHIGIDQHKNEQIFTHNICCALEPHDPVFLRDLCFKLKISVTWRPEAKNWIVVRYNQYENPEWINVHTTQLEIDEAILSCAYVIVNGSE